MDSTVGLGVAAKSSSAELGLPFRSADESALLLLSMLERENEAPAEQDFQAS